MNERIEKDSMGEMAVPENALYGAQTARAIQNFPVSGAGIGRELIRSLGQVKFAAAEVNRDLGKLDPSIADAILGACREVVEGKLDGHFPVDVFQTGSGTSSNMNANEVIANRAAQLMKADPGTRPVHPNDHVNMGQSSNDVFPTAIHLAVQVLVEKNLLPALEELRAGFEVKARAFDGIVTTGRTHLQDATPVRLGQVFAGYASQVAHGASHIEQAGAHMRELAIGGTAVGTGINTHPEFGKRVAKKLANMTGVDFVEAPDHFEAQSAQDAAVQMSGALKTLSTALIKVANDIRFLGSGPRLGLGELVIPPVQPGSSIMPGKVNPVIAESLIMVCAQVIGNDTAITLGGLYGNFQLNVMLPLIARNLIEQVHLLTHAVTAFKEKLIEGLEADRERIESRNERSLSLATALAPRIGYDRAAEIAKKALATGKTVRQIALEENVLPRADLDRLLDPMRQTEPEK